MGFFQNKRNLAMATILAGGVLLLAAAGSWALQGDPPSAPTPTPGIQTTSAASGTPTATDEAPTTLPSPTEGGPSMTPTSDADPTSKPTATPDASAFVWPKPDRRAVAKVSQVNGIPRLSINGMVVPPVMFFGNTDINARYAVIEEEFRKAGAGGIHLHSIISSPGLRDTRVDGEKYFDLENDLDCAITGDPDGFVLLRVNVGRYGNTSGYAESELVKFASSRFTAGPMVSIASDAWLTDAKKMLKDTVTFIRTNPSYSKHVIGYHLECGEWFQYMFRENGVDISEANSRKFREWLKVKYATDAALRSAWDSPGISLATAVVPSDLPGNLHFVSEQRTLMLLSSDQRYVDYLDYISDLVSGRIAELAATIKATCADENIVIAFYGYLFEHSDPESGHFSLRRLLADEHLDGFAGPLTYLDRNYNELYPKKAPGSTGAAMTVVDSVQRAGKIWFNESDNRTFINRTGSTTENDTYLVPIETVREIVEVHKRDIGQVMIRGGAVWFMDLWSVGWLDDDAIWKSDGRLASLYATYAKTQHVPKYDVAYLVDEKAMSLVAQPTDSAWSFLSYQRYDMYRAGISFGTFTLEDLADGRIPDARVLFVLDPFRIDAAKAEKLKTAAEKGDRTLVFVYGFGTTASVDIAKLTGMDIRSTAARGSVRLTPTTAASGFGLGGKSFFGADVAATPRWYVAGGADSVLANYADLGLAGFATKDNGTFRSVFFGGMRMDTDTIRAIVRYGGGHVFLATDDVTMASDDLVVVHASRAGAKTVRFPSKTDVYDYFTGEWSIGVTSVTIAMQEAETRYLFYGSRTAILAKSLPAWKED